MRITRYLPNLPLLDSLREYNTSKWRGDLNAGVMVGILLVPQGMAYAVLAGLPPVYGLYASIVPLLIYALFGSSRHLAVGPVAMISLLVVAGIGELAEVGSERFIRLAILAAFGAGLLQLLMGLLKMGFLVNFLSHPVLSGFTSAAALIIAASQLGNLLGLETVRGTSFNETILAVITDIGSIEPTTALIGLGSLLFILLIRVWKKTAPASLLAVVIATAVSAFWNLEAGGVRVVGNIPGGLPLPGIDGFDISELKLLFPIILVISLVSYMESIAVAKSIASRRGYRIDPDQELVALGASNLGGSFFQSFPVTGGFSRTAVNDQSGAQSGVASIISAGIVMLTLLFLTPLFHSLPMAVLAAIIVVAVFSLLDLKSAAALWRSDRRDLAMLLTTFGATLLLGIVEGILVGVILSLAMVIYSSTTPHTAELGQLGKSRNFRNIRRYPEASVDPELLIFRFDSQLYFANVEHFRETLEKHVEKKGANLKRVILDASAIHNIDSTGIHTLSELIGNLRLRRIGVSIAGAIGPVRDKLKSSGITEVLGEDRFFFDVAHAVADHAGSVDDRDASLDEGFSPSQSNR